LATYGVLPSHQGRGIGKRLMAAVLDHAGARAGIFSSSTHPGATRRYRLAGFTLHPQMRMVGTLDRSTLPAADGLREGGADDFAWMDRLDQDLRIAGHGPTTANCSTPHGWWCPGTRRSRGTPISTTMAGPRYWPPRTRRSHSGCCGKP